MKKTAYLIATISIILDVIVAFTGCTENKPEEIMTQSLPESVTYIVL
jgi:hypothetical protein